MCVGLTACGATASSPSSSDSGSSAATVSSNNNSAPAQTAQSIELNQTVTNENLELTLTGVEWTDKIEKQLSEYTSTEVTASSNGADVLLVVRGTFKNLGGSNYSTSAMTVTCKANDKYDLSGSVFPYDSIKPLSTGELSFYIPMSNEMKDTFKSGTMNLKFKSCSMDGDAIQINSDVIGEYELKITV